MQKRKRMISMVLAGALFVAAIPAGRIDVQAEELVKAYIVKTESATECAVISECYMEDIEAEPADGGAEGLLEERGIFKVELTPAEAQALEQEEGVVGVEEDIVLKGCSQTGENLGQAQWNLEAIHKGTAQMGDADVKVALVDSGVAQTEDIDVAKSISFLAEGEADGIGDTNGHGTAMAGMIAAKDNGIGITGVAPGVSLYSLQVLDSSNHCTLSQLLSAIYWACENGMDIINLSLGTEVDSSLLHQAVADAKAKGCLVVAAGGNNGTQDIMYPAAYKEVFAVGATDNRGNLVDGYGIGKELDILAPGIGIPTTGVSGEIVVLDGTSISAAQVTGAAALILSRDCSKESDFVCELLKYTSSLVSQAEEYETGLLDIGQAMDYYGEFTRLYGGEGFKDDGVLSGSGQVTGGEQGSIQDNGDMLFSGLWAANAHASLAAEIASGIILDKHGDTDVGGIALIQDAARMADTVYGTSKEKACPALHGVGNYVLYLKYLFYIAEYLKDGDDFDTANKKVRKMFTDEMISGSRFTNLRRCTKELIATDINPKYSETSGQRRYCKILGFAMHLIGDVYAHRTIVPRKTVAGVNPYNPVYGSNSMFGSGSFIYVKNDNTHKMESEKILLEWAKNSGDYDSKVNKENPICKNWECFQKTVFLGVMEFRDIKHYLKADTNRTGVYEDNLDFCPERYKDTRRACKGFLNRSFSGDTFTYKIFWSKYGNKLNNFKTYTKKALETVEGSDEEWDAVSTLNEV